MALGSHSNVHNTCLNILKKQGYRLWLHYDDEDLPLAEADLSMCLWCAEKNGYKFIASNPIELLGLAKIYEFKGEPKTDEIPYWWRVIDEKVRDELIEKLFLDD
ncbi:hypothetical protein [Hahella sp. HN01]|uniref:hypothetical protein n=1 Tax=Hahella sp. HN01 TaxID=2847262 RepID=UPI001C1ECD97|nr:hypothetical protein [Hahella sp. HN01]MBU6953599.1 hypothetical protein [Hahella sp. HN01]